jgi:hypothetical protein
MNFYTIFILLIVLAPLLEAARHGRPNRAVFGKTRRIDSGSRIPGMVSLNLDTDDFAEYGAEIPYGTKLAAR